jgi:hypothetical protein
LELSDRVRSFLATWGLSLAELSRQSRSTFPANPRFRIPPNFYDVLRRPSFSPSLHQVYALSMLTDFALADWLSVFGFSFDDAARFQASFPQYQTVELDSRIYDPAAKVSWFERDTAPSLGIEPASLSNWLSGPATRPLDSLSTRPSGSFRYLKIGSRDAYAFPDLLPGSIVRVKSGIPADKLLAQDGESRILAIAAGPRIFCGRVRSVGDRRVVLCSRQLSYPPVEWKLGTEAKIIGYVDIELRPLNSQQAPEVPTSWRRPRETRASSPPSNPRRIGTLIRSARLRSGLPFSEASERTRRIAHALGHRLYFCAPATLSDLESSDLVPRHIHKLISLSAVYCLPLAELAVGAGLRLEGTSQGATRSRPRFPLAGDTAVTAPSHSPFLQKVEDEFQEVPFFLWKALPSYLGIPNLSIQNFYWAGATGDLAHPYLRNAAFLAVDSRSKTPTPSLTSPMWAQPLYVLELRSGRRLCATCHLEDGTLVVRSCTAGFAEILRLRYPGNVEVLGKVVAILRRP